MKIDPCPGVIDIIAFPFSWDDLSHLDVMMIEGGFKSRADLIRSLIRAIIKDDKAAHGETA